MTPNAICRFFEIDLTSVGGSILYFHPGQNETGGNVVWGGREYQPFPLVIEGIGYDTKQLPNPELTVSNLDGQLGALVKQYRDLTGCTVKVRTTFAQYLDAVNFVGGNPLANPAVEFPPELYIIERKAEETSDYIKFELASALNLEGQRTPTRCFNATCCTHLFRGPLCGYVGAGMWDENDNVTTDPTKDKCGKRMTSCQKRFPGELPFGAFPMVGLLGRAS